MLRHEIRAAAPEDEEHLLKLAGFLDTINLPNDRASIRDLLEHASRSFSGKIADPRERKFVFVLWDLDDDAAVGTSMILAQHGRRDAPYIYFDVIPEEKYSRSLDRHFHHTLLRIGFSYDGPTEIGGLVVHPECRRSPERLGLMISYVRFLFIACYRSHFQNYLIAELLPPLEADGTSHLWEAVGRHFTSMSYGEADFLSSQDKGFIRDLFPSGFINASLLDPKAQDVIGKVGAQTKGVEKMLRRIGFDYANRVDPFDGGPHFVGSTDQITLIRDAQRLPVSGVLLKGRAFTALVAQLSDEPPYFRAVKAQVQLDRGGCVVEPRALDHLGLTVGDEVALLKLR